MVFGMSCHASLKKGVRVCEFPKELLIRILHVEQDMQDMATTCTCKSLKGDKSSTYSVVSNVYCWPMSVNCWVSVGLAVDLGALPICALNMEQNHSHFNLKI